MYWIIFLLRLWCIRDVIGRITAPKKIPCHNSQHCECDKISPPKTGYLEWQKGTLLSLLLSREIIVDYLSGSRVILGPLRTRSRRSLERIGQIVVELKMEGATWEEMEVASRSKEQPPGGSQEGNGVLWLPMWGAGFFQEEVFQLGRGSHSSEQRTWPVLQF